jgi:hypothetical protein
VGGCCYMKLLAYMQLLAHENHRPSVNLTPPQLRRTCYLKTAEAGALTTQTGSRTGRCTAGATDAAMTSAATTAATTAAAAGAATTTSSPSTYVQATLSISSSSTKAQLPSGFAEAQGIAKNGALYVFGGFEGGWSYMSKKSYRLVHHFPTLLVILSPRNV